MESTGTKVWKGATTTGKKIKPYLKVAILCFNTHSVIIENLPETESAESATDYLSEVLGYDLSNCQYMINPKNIGFKSPRGV